MSGEGARKCLPQTGVNDRRLPTVSQTSGGCSRISYQVIVQMVTDALEDHLL